MNNKCCTKRCRNSKAKKTNGYRLRYCWKCKSRLLKLRHPATYFLNTLRQSAKKRGIGFSLTLEEFKSFCGRTGFLERRGKKPTDWTIDRIKTDEGYHIHNIRSLEHQQNSAQGKYNVPRALRKWIENCR